MQLHIKCVFRLPFLMLNERNCGRLYCGGRHQARNRNDVVGIKPLG